MVFSRKRRTPTLLERAVGEVRSSLSPARTHCLAPQLFTSGHREDVSLVIVVISFRWLFPCIPLVQMVSMGSMWSYTCNIIMRMEKV